MEDEHNYYGGGDYQGDDHHGYNDDGQYGTGDGDHDQWDMTTTETHADIDNTGDGDHVQVDTIATEIHVNIDKYEEHMNNSASDEELQNNLRQTLKVIKRLARQLRDIDPSDEEAQTFYQMLKHSQRGKYDGKHDDPEDPSHIEYNHDMMWDSDDESGMDSDSEAGGDDEEGWGDGQEEEGWGDGQEEYGQGQNGYYSAQHDDPDNQDYGQYHDQQNHDPYDQGDGYSHDSYDQPQHSPQHQHGW